MMYFQVTNLSNDTERKMSFKADSKELEAALPKKFEERCHFMNEQIRDLKHGMQQCAAKEDFHVLSANKVDITMIYIHINMFLD